MPLRDSLAKPPHPGLPSTGAGSQVSRPVHRRYHSRRARARGQARHFIVVLEVVIDYAPYEAGYPGYQDLLSQTKPRF